MCARYTLTTEETELLQENKYKLVGEYFPDSNVAITDIGFVVTSDEPTLVQKMHFGIVHHYAKTKAIGFDTWNIRSEEVLTKKSYEPLMRHRKTCLVIMDGFYEWQEEANGEKQPWKFVVPGRKTFCCAGLWSRWVDQNTGEVYDNFGIMTCKANDTVGEVHQNKRMPVILHKSEENIWLNKKLSIDELLSLCVTFPDNKMQRYQVSKKVNKVSTIKVPNKGMELSLPLNKDMKANQQIVTKENEVYKKQIRRKPEQPEQPNLFS